MDAITISAASGIRSRMESFELLANNIANQATAGYKSDREFYTLYVAPEALVDAGVSTTSQPQTLPVIRRQWTDFSQGTLSTTGNSLDLALSGEGFFVVKGPSGKLYTRNGSFHLSKGGVIVTQQGYPLLDRNNAPIQVDQELPLEIGTDGTVRQDGATVAKIAVAAFRDPEVLSKHAGNYFQVNSPGVSPQPARSAEVFQGKLESANFPPAAAAVRLVGVLRQFEMLQKAVRLNSEMNNKTIQEVARVGS